MPLNIGGGSFIPHIRWMSQTEQWTISSDGGGQQSAPWTECIFDLANIKTGWGVFGAGLPPEWVLDLSLTETAKRPGGDRDWKRGFRVNVFSPQSFGGDGLREFASTSTGATMGINEVYTNYEAQAPANPGMVPLVTFSGVNPMRIGKGPTNQPVLIISRWVPRPPALDAALAALAALVEERRLKALAEVAQTVTQTTTTVVPVAPVTGQLSQPAAPQPAPGPAAIPVAPPPAVVADPLAPTATAAPAAPAPSTTSEF